MVGGTKRSPERGSNSVDHPLIKDFVNALVSTEFVFVWNVWSCLGLKVGCLTQWWNGVEKIMYIPESWLAIGLL